MKAEDAAGLLEQVRQQKPLIFNITNVVVADFNANGLLSLGASPVMANAPEEAADMAKAADALVLNIGTLHSEQVKSMMLAGKAANEKGIPVVLDPVGAGATTYRTNTTLELLETLDISLLRGNAAEAAAIAGLESEGKGVDAAGGDKDTKKIAESASRMLGIPVAVTGAVDAISNGMDTYSVYNGHSMMSRVTGTGCLASAVTASFLARTDEVPRGAAAALGFYGTAAQKAADLAARKGPGSFQAELLNALYQVGSKDLQEYISIAREKAGNNE